MSTSPWRPGNLKRRLALEPAVEGVPDYLARPLLSWLHATLHPGGYFDTGRFKLLALALGIPTQDPERVPLTAWENFARAIAADTTALLDAIEWTLERPIPAVTRSAGDLELILSHGRSAYRLSPDASCLEMRVDPTVREAVQAAVDTSVGSAGEHLAEAWARAYGVKSDPSKAYSEAIKAVEAAAAPIVSPANSKATLGTMIPDISNKPIKWHFEIDNGIDGVDVVLQLMRLLWSGQTSRHGGIAPTRLETPPEAQAAVNLAATLVQWCSTGAFRLR